MKEAKFNEEAQGEPEDPDAQSCAGWYWSQRFNKEVRNTKDGTRQQEDTEDVSNLFSHKSHDQQLS